MTLEKLKGGRVNLSHALVAVEMGGCLDREKGRHALTVYAKKIQSDFLYYPKHGSV